MDRWGFPEKTAERVLASEDPWIEAKGKVAGLTFSSQASSGRIVDRIDLEATQSDLGPSNYGETQDVHRQLQFSQAPNWSEEVASSGSQPSETQPNHTGFFAKKKTYHKLRKHMKVNSQPQYLTMKTGGQLRYNTVCDPSENENYLMCGHCSDQRLFKTMQIFERHGHECPGRMQDLLGNQNTQPTQQPVVPSLGPFIPTNPNPQPVAASTFVPTNPTPQPVAASTFVPPTPNASFPPANQTAYYQHVTPDSLSQPTQVQANEPFVLSQPVIRSPVKGTVIQPLLVANPESEARDFLQNLFPRTALERLAERRSANFENARNLENARLERCSSNCQNARSCSCDEKRSIEKSNCAERCSSKEISNCAENCSGKRSNCTERCLGKRSRELSNCAERKRSRELSNCAERCSGHRKSGCLERDCSERCDSLRKRTCSHESAECEGRSDKESPLCYRQATDSKDNSLMVQAIENSQKQVDRKPIETNSRKASRKREVSRKKSTSRKRIREKWLKTRGKSRKPKTCVEPESVPISQPEFPPISLQPTQCSLPYAFAEHYSGWFANWRRGEIFRLGNNTVSQGSQATTTMEHNETQTRSLSPLNEIQASQTQEDLLFSMPPIEDFSPSAQFGYLNVHADSTDAFPCEDLFSVPLFSQQPTMDECRADRKNGFQRRQVHTRKRIGSQMRLSSDRKRGARSVCNFRRRNHEVASDSEKSQSPQQRRVKREKNERKREENHRSKIRRVKKENMLPPENQRIQPVADRIRRVKQEDLCKIAQNATQMCNLKSNKEKEIVSDSESDIQKHFDREKRVKWRSKKVAPQRCVERVQMQVEQTSPSKTPPKSASTDSGLGASTDCSRPMNKLQLQRTKMKQTPLVDAIKQSPLAKHVPKFARHSQRKTSCIRNLQPDKRKESKPRVSAPEGPRVVERKRKAQCRHSEVSKKPAVSIASLAENRAKWTNARASGNGVQVPLVKERRVWEHRATLERVKNSRVALDSREIRTKQEQRPPENVISQPKIRKLERGKNSNLVVKKTILKDDKAKTTKPHARDVKMKMIFDRIMRDAKNSYAAATSTRR